MPTLIKNLPPLLLAFIAVVIWGFNFVATTIAVTNLSPFLVLTIRFFLVSLILLPFFPKPPIAISKILIISFTFGFCHLGTMFLSLHMGLSASVGIVVDQIGVPFTILLAFLIFQEKPTPLELTGVILAIFGTFFLAKTPNSMGNPTAFILMIAAGLFWALYSIELKKFKAKSALGLVAWISFFSFFITLTISLIYEDNHKEMLQNASFINWFAVSYTAIFASIIAHGIWGYLMTTQEINKIIPMILLVPIFGVFGGVFILNEEVTNEMIIGSILMILGVKISFLKKLDYSIIGKILRRK